MHELSFQSPDNCFGLTVPMGQWRKLKNICQAGTDMETGGILVGYYTRAHDRAVVTEVSEPPSDSTAGKRWFQRGVAMLQKWLHELWTRKTRYYLGEWHLHPMGAPNPSSTDIREMARIARSIRFRCPEPILLLVAGKNGQFTPGAFVFLRNGDFIQLHLHAQVLGTRPASGHQRPRS